MNRAILLSSVTAACLGLAAPSFSAEPLVNSAGQSKPATKMVAAPASAATCVTDIRGFSKSMQKAGNWLGGYGYPLNGYGYGYGYPMTGDAVGASSRYLHARPGYEVRSLLVTANILAQNGQQRACEAVLASTRKIYTRYSADFHGEEGPRADNFSWQRRQIANAVSVTATTAAVRSDQLIDTEVLNAQSDALGSVHDLIIDPKTGKIAYLVLAHGGLFGFDQSFVPVPWDDFKISVNGNLLVLDTTNAIVEAAPMATDAQFRAAGQFVDRAHKVDAYWAASLPTKAASK